MIALIVLVLATSLEYLVEHPDLAKMLVTEAMEAIKQLNEHGEKMSVEQRTAIESGLAAARANAVQEYMRRKGLQK